MIISAPTASTRQPHYFEGSRLRSLRDRDAVSRAWILNRTTAHRNNSDSNQQFFANQKLARLRRRIVGGGTTSTSGLVFKGEYNGGAYAANSMVVFTPDGGAAGTYISTKAVPAGVSPDTGNPYWIALPFPPAGVWS